MNETRRFACRTRQRCLSGHLGRRGLADPVNTCLPVLVSGWSHKGKKRFEMLKAAWPKRRAEALPSLPRSIPTCAAHPFQTSLACPPAVSSSAAGPLSPPSPGSPPARPRGRCWSSWSSDLQAHAQPQWRGAVGEAQGSARAVAPQGPADPSLHFASSFSFSAGCGDPAGMGRGGWAVLLLPAEGLGVFVPHFFPGCGCV